MQVQARRAVLRALGVPPGREVTHQHLHTPSKSFRWSQAPSQAPSSQGRSQSQLQSPGRLSPPKVVLLALRVLLVLLVLLVP